MNARDRRAQLRRRIGRGWLSNARVEQALCIAVLADGRHCHKPASFIDPTRGGMVCEEHKLVDG